MERITALGKTLRPIAVCAGAFVFVLCGKVNAEETNPATRTLSISLRDEVPHEIPKTPAAEVIALLTRALNERRVLGFTYHGYTREVEPHALGIAKSGGVALLAFQIGGGSESEPPPGWRTFVVSEMTKLQLPVIEVERPPTGRNASGSGVAVKNGGPEVVGLPRTFAAPRPSYRKEHTAFLSIEAEVRGASGVGSVVTGPGGSGARPSALEAGVAPKTKRRTKR